MPEMLDAVVIGAGPAGSAAAISLASQGLKTTLIEKSAGARHKVCGEFFSPGVWPLFEKLGITDKILRTGGKPVWDTSLFFPSQTAVRMDLPEVSNQFPFAFALSRFVFDEVLMRQAALSGCEIIPGNEAVSVREEKDHCVVKLLSGVELKTRKVVVAAGKTSRFQKQKSGGNVGFKAHFQNMRKPQGLEMHFFRGGYLGLLEIEKGKVNLCGMLDKKLLTACGGNFENVMNHASAASARLKEWLGSAIRITPWLSCVTSRGFQGKDTERIFYTGDSACFVEPMIGQGMTLALASGIRTAEKTSGKKIFKSKLNFLKAFEPMAVFCTRFPMLAKPWAGIFLREPVLRKLLSTP